MRKAISGAVWSLQLILLFRPAQGCQLGGCRSVAKGSLSARLGIETRGSEFAVGGKQSVSACSPALPVSVSARHRVKAVSRRGLLCQPAPRHRGSAGDGLIPGVTYRAATGSHTASVLGVPSPGTRARCGRGERGARTMSHQPLPRDVTEVSGEAMEEPLEPGGPPCPCRLVGRPPQPQCSQHSGVPLRVLQCDSHPTLWAQPQGVWLHGTMTSIPPPAASSVQGPPRARSAK